MPCPSPACSTTGNDLKGNTMSRWVLALALAPVLVSVCDIATAEPYDGSKATDQLPAADLPNCPVMGEPINFAWSVSTDDGPVFFCCRRCIGKYESEPAKYAAAVSEQRKALSARDRIQVACPVTGEPPNPKIAIEHGGGRVSFCCKGCLGKFQSDPSKYKSALANSYTYQTVCPVMGEAINPKVFATISDHRKVFLCCKRCTGKLWDYPAKYIAKLAAQGFSVSADAIAPPDSNKAH